MLNMSVAATLKREDMPFAHPYNNAGLYQQHHTGTAFDSNTSASLLQNQSPSLAPMTATLPQTPQYTIQAPPAPVNRPKRKTPAPIIPPVSSPPSAFARRSSFASTGFLPLSPYPHSPSSQPTISLTPSTNSSSPSPSPFSPLPPLTGSPNIAQSPFAYSYTLNPYSGTSNDNLQSLAPFASLNVHGLQNNGTFITSTPFEQLGGMSPTTTLPLSFSSFTASPLYNPQSAQTLSWPMQQLPTLSQAPYPALAPATTMQNMMNLPATPSYPLSQSMAYMHSAQPFTNSQPAATPLAAPLSPPDIKPRIATVQLGSNSKEGREGYSYVCNYPNCGDSFKTRFSLKRHSKKHSGVKPYVCQHNGCNKRFAEKSTLKRHLRIHTGEKPYQCSVPGCGKTFADRTNVKRHEMIHSGDRPYWCTVPDCKRGYFWRKHLKKHLYSVHGIGEPVDKSDQDEDEDAPSDYDEDKDDI